MVSLNSKLFDFIGRNNENSLVSTFVIVFKIPNFFSIVETEYFSLIESRYLKIEIELISENDLIPMEANSLTIT